MLLIDEINNKLPTFIGQLYMTRLHPTWVNALHTEYMVVVFFKVNIKKLSAE